MLRESKKRPEIVNPWILYHNSPTHTALCVREFLVSKKLLEHPAYSPDLAPSDFLFPKTKEILNEMHFDDIKNNTTAALKAISQNQFQNCFEGSSRRWYRCIASKGGYFEGDHGGFQQ